MDDLFNKWCWEDRTSTYKQMTLDPDLTSYIKINSKQIKEQNIRPQTVKLLEASMGKMLHDIAFGNIFLDMTSKAQAVKAKIDKWDHLKLKSFYIAKETTK